MSLILLWLHVLAAITWIGGMLFIVLVLVPITRRFDDRALRTQLVQATGRRFRTVGWVALAVLIGTGLGNLQLHPYLFGSPELGWKLALVGLVLILSVLHDFVLGPRAGLVGSAPSVRVWTSWLARLNVLVALVIVLLGLALPR